MSPAVEPDVRPTRLEIAASCMVGSDSSGGRLPTTVTATPLQALERALLPSLQRAPCLISFSGGRDSSLLLAVATRVARREGLPEPIPATFRFPGVDRAQESEWQDLLISRLDPPDWIRHDVSDEFDLLGPVAQEMLVAHGLLWPPTAYALLPLIRRAQGGSFLTGIPGDVVLQGRPPASGRWPLTEGGRIARSMFRAAPLPLRTEVVRRRRVVPLRTWLRPAAQRTLARSLTSGEPRGSTRTNWLEWLRRQRGPLAVLTATALIGSGWDVRVSHPLFDPEFLAALGAAVDRLRPVDRDAVMVAFFSDVLPPEVLRRPTKASFGSAYCGEATRAFVRDWDGDGFMEDLVDVGLVRELWAGGNEMALMLTPLLVHAAWLHSHSTAGLQPEAETGVWRSLS